MIPWVADAGFMGRLDSEQRAKILEAAIDTFAEHGLKAATIRLVGRQAGVNSALIYYYFENKETMFVEAVRQALDGFFDLLESRREPFSTARQRLGFLVNGLFDYYCGHPKHMLMMATAMHQHPELMAKTINSLLRARTALPFEIISEGIRLKQFRPENPAVMWWGILGMCLFAFRAQKVFAHLDLTGIPIRPPDWQAHREKVLELLLGGMALASETKKTSAARVKA